MRFRTTRVIFVKGALWVDYMVVCVFSTGSGHVSTHGSDQTYMLLTLEFFDASKQAS